MAAINIQLPWDSLCRMACHAMVNKITIQQVIDQTIANYQRNIPQKPIHINRHGSVKEPTDEQDRAMFRAAYNRLHLSLS